MNTYHEDCQRTVEARLHRRHFSVVSSGSSSASAAAPSVAVSSVLVEPDDTQEWGREGDAVTSPMAAPSVAVSSVLVEPDDTQEWGREGDAVTSPMADLMS